MTISFRPCLALRGIGVRAALGPECRASVFVDSPSGKAGFASLDFYWRRASV